MSPVWREALAGLLLLSGCASARRVEPSAAALSAADATLAARLIATADARLPDTLLIREALGSSSAYVRQSAARVAGQVRMKAMLPTLHALLASADTAVAAEAAFALGVMRDSSSVAALARALDGPVTVASEAAWSLGEIGAPARSAVVAGLARGRSQPAPVAAALLLAASKLRPVPYEAVAPYLERPAAASAPASVRITAAAAYVVARPMLPAGVRALLAHAASPDVDTRARVARALARSATGDSLADLALAALRQLATDAHPHVRINALRALGSHGPRAAEALAAGVRDADANVRIAAAQSVATAFPDTSGAWAAMWEADTSLMFRRGLLESAMRAGRVLEAMRTWAASDDWRMRGAVADAAAGAGWDRMWSHVQPLLHDRDARVRRAAFGAIDRWADSTARPEARQSLVAALGDRDFYVRAVAMGALARRPTAAETGRVLDAWRRSVADSGNDARIAAARYVAAAWRVDSASFPDSLVRALQAIPVAGEALVRAEVRGISPFATWPGTEGTAREPAWYERVVADVVAPTLAGSAPTADIVTERGTITIRLYGAEAPITVDNFVGLARRGYYRGTRFHRVVPNFVAQDGDPEGDGNGGPGYAIRDEFNRRRYDRGAVGMALSGEDTGGSQYFITHSPQPHLDGHYTVFGHVVAGWEALDRLVQGDRILEVRVR